MIPSDREKSIKSDYSGSTKIWLILNQYPWPIIFVSIIKYSTFLNLIDDSLIFDAFNSTSLLEGINRINPNLIQILIKSSWAKSHHKIKIRTLWRELSQTNKMLKLNIHHLMNKIMR